jgi:hypothetical protein
MPTCMPASVPHLASSSLLPVSSTWSYQGWHAMDWHGRLGRGTEHGSRESHTERGMQSSHECQTAPHAFKDSMIHGDAHVTLPIAFRCVLHRCENQDIPCAHLLFLPRHEHRHASTPVDIHGKTGIQAYRHGTVVHGAPMALHGCSLG